MPFTRHAIYGDASAWHDSPLVGLSGRIEHNLGSQSLADEKGRLGSVPLSFDGGAFSVDLPATDDATVVEQVTGTLQYRVLLSFTDPGGGGRRNWDSGWFSLTADVNVFTVDGAVSAEAAASGAAFLAEMEALRDEVLAPTETQVRTVVTADIADPGTEIGGALSETIGTSLSTPGSPGQVAADARYVVRADSLASLPTPFYFAHRMGGGPAPEATMEAGRIAVAGGTDGLELDLQPLGDDSLGVMHDATVDATTDGVGDVSDYTALTWRTLNAADYIPWNGRIVPPALFSELIAEFAGKIPLMVEPKDDSTAEQLMDTADAFGLRGSLVVATNSTTVLDAAVARGYAAYFYWSGAVTAPTPASVVAAGATWLGLNGITRPDADVTTLVNTGLPVVPYTINRRKDRDRLLALGVVGFLTDQPVYLRRDAAMRKSDSWRQGIHGHGLLAYNNSSVPRNPATIDADKGLLLATNASTVSHVVGEVSPIANAAGTYQITVQAAFKALPASSSAALIVHFGGSDDGAYLNSAGYYRPGYTCYITKGGSLRLYRLNDADTFTQLGASQATAALVADTLVTLQIDVTPTDVTITRTDSGGFTPISQPDATFRGGYVQVAKFGAGDVTAKFKALTVTP